MPRSEGVAVLFARRDSIYKEINGCDVWDIERDARKWGGGMPVVAHPPCRAWGSLRHFAKPRPDEKDLARQAVAWVRRWGGVLEHPFNSTLWLDQALPQNGQRDRWGGFTFSAPQFWWGHPANKATKFYICGVSPAEIPAPMFALGTAQFAVSGGGSKFRKLRGWKDKPTMNKSLNEVTPPALAHWLVELARRCEPTE